MRVSSIMTVEPVTISPSATPDEAVQLMDEHGVRHLPVMEGGVLLGVVSDRDLLEATGWLPRRVRGLRQEPVTGPEKLTVRELTHTPAMAVAPDDSVVTVAIEAVVQSIGCLPVVQDGALLGIVTETDLLNAYVEAIDGKRLRRDESPPVSQVMTRTVTTIDRETTVAEAERLSRANFVRHFPVMYAERLEGILSDRDLRRAVGRGRRGDCTVDKVMTSDLITVSSSAPLHEVARLMLEHKISAIPVVDDLRLSGICTSTDMLDFCIDHLREPEPGSQLERETS